MKTQLRAHLVGALVVLGFSCYAPQVQAGPVSACDQIAADAKAAAGKDPTKVLMIVEDALVINETCACEIAKAAITASNADTAMAQQIVQTALAVAPKMTAVITECAEAVSPGSTKASEDVAKSKDKAEGTDFGDAWATNIRGIYLIQPAAAGVVTQVVEFEDGDDDEGGENDNNDRSNSRRTRNLVPLSPAWAN